MSLFCWEAKRWSESTHVCPCSHNVTVKVFVFAYLCDLGFIERCHSGKLSFVLKQFLKSVFHVNQGVFPGAPVSSHSPEPCLSAE